MISGHLRELEKRYRLRDIVLDKGAFGLMMVAVPIKDAENHIFEEILFENEDFQIPDSVAVKFVLLKAGDDASDDSQAAVWDNVLLEADHLFQLRGQTKKVVQLYEAFVGSNLCCLVMEHLTGGSLFETVSMFEEFTEDDARKIIYELLLILSHCHERGIYHRDIKPESILMRKKSGLKELKDRPYAKFGKKLGPSVDMPISTLADAENRFEVVLADFGLSSNTPLNAENDGSLRFVAPEILRANGGEKVDYEKADVWSMGAIAFMLFSGGSLLFDGDLRNILATVKDQDMMEFALERKGINHLSKECKMFLSTILVVDPENRHSTGKLLMNKYFLASPIKLANNKINLADMQEYIRMANLEKEQSLTIVNFETSLIHAMKSSNDLGEKEIITKILDILSKESA